MTTLLSQHPVVSFSLFKFLHDSFLFYCFHFTSTLFLSFIYFYVSLFTVLFFITSIFTSMGVRQALIGGNLKSCPRISKFSFLLSSQICLRTLGLDPMAFKLTFIIKTWRKLIDMVQNFLIIQKNIYNFPY